MCFINHDINVLLVDQFMKYICQMSSCFTFSSFFIAVQKLKLLLSATWNSSLPAITLHWCLKVQAYKISLGWMKWRENNKCPRLILQTHKFHILPSNATFKHLLQQERNLDTMNIDFSSISSWYLTTKASISPPLHI